MYQFNIEFEYDGAKSQANYLKQGLSLEDAKLLWKILGAESKSLYSPEDRWLRVGIIEEKFYTCIFTYRGEKIRPISLRRSREEEINRYYMMHGDIKK